VVLPASHKVSRVSWYSGLDLLLILFTYRTFTFCGGTFQFSSVKNAERYDLSTTPGTSSWFGLFPVRSPLLRKSIFLSLPPGTEMFQFPGFTSMNLWIQFIVYIVDVRVSPFGNLRITGYLRLPEAYRSLSRPSSAPDAKAFTMRPL
jgi:hypothetical protein